MIGAPPQAATEAYAAELDRIRRLVALRVQTLTLAVVDPGDQVGWARLTTLGTDATVAGQEAAKRATADYAMATLEAAGADLAPVQVPIQPGYLGSGRDVQGMFMATQNVVAGRTAGGATFTDALAASAQYLVGVAASEPHRIGRDGLLRTGLSDDRFERYRRVAVGATCDFCLMLATRGAVYLSAESAGASRKYHTHCVPAGTVVTSPGTEAATRRWYEGELVVVATASGKQLRITPNHPVLTDHGWVDAGSLKVGDHVIDGSRLDGQRLGVPDVDDAPALIGDVFQSIRMRGDAVRVESSPEDFYGDGLDGYIDVVRPYGPLDHDRVSAPSKRIADQSLTIGWRLGGVLLPRQGGRGESFGAELAASHGGMGGRRSLRSIFGGRGRCAYHRRFGSASNPNPAVVQFGEQGAAGHAVTTSDGQSGLASHVLLDGLVGHIQPAWTAAGRAAARFDPISAHQDWDHVRAYAQKGADLLVRVAGQVALDPVVKVRRVQWSGHVFDLQTVEGWYVADGLMVANCDCRIELVVGSDAINRSQALQGDWRNAIRDEQRLIDAGAMDGPQPLDLAAKRGTAGPAVPVTAASPQFPRPAWARGTSGAPLDRATAVRAVGGSGTHSYSDALGTLTVDEGHVGDAVRNQAVGDTVANVRSNLYDALDQLPQNVRDHVLRNGYEIAVDGEANSISAAAFTYAGQSFSKSGPSLHIFVSPGSVGGRSSRHLLRGPFDDPDGYMTSIPGLKRGANTLVHEIGHTVDRLLMDDAKVLLARVKRTAGRDKTLLSGYGRTDAREMVAETFVRWVRGDTDEVVRMVAEAQGWADL